jgi:hypothetical protein
MYEHTKDSVEYVFGDSIATLTESPEGVDVTFERGAPRRFDLVVGADGLHSLTRRLAFGEESRYLRFLDHYVAGFGVPNDLGLDRTSRVYSEPGRAGALGNYDGDPDRADALLVFRSEKLEFGRRDVTAQKRILAERFAGMGWEAPKVLKALDEADDLYFDAIAQIHVDRLTQGRVALLGEPGTAPPWAAWAPGSPSSARTSSSGSRPWRTATTAPRSPSTRRGSGLRPGLPEDLRQRGPVLRPGDRAEDPQPRPYVPAPRLTPPRGLLQEAHREGGHRHQAEGVPRLKAQP